MGSKDTVLSKVLKILEEKYEIRPLFGLEIEFYLHALSQDNDISNKIDEYSNRLFGEFKIQKESGESQYELCTTTEYPAFTAINKLYKMRNKIITFASNNDLSVNFAPKPLPNDYGSSMHVNVSLHSTKDNSNLYSHNCIEKNAILLQSIGGILAILEKSIHLFTKGKQNEFDRLIPKFMAPTSINWGKNNRTTTIRIPNSINTKRRIEFRLPSSQANIEETILFLCTGILYGIKHRIIPPKPVYCNTEDSEQGCSPSLKSAIASKDAFTFYTIIDTLLSEYY